MPVPKSRGRPWEHLKLIPIDSEGYVPCDCQDKCGDDCGCAGQATFCDRFCNCPPSCSSSFLARHAGEFAIDALTGRPTKVRRMPRPLVLESRVVLVPRPQPGVSSRGLRLLVCVFRHVLLFPALMVAHAASCSNSKIRLHHQKATTVARSQIEKGGYGCVCLLPLSF